MRKGQTSVEYLLLTAGVILIGVIASQAVVSSSTATHAAIEEEINAHVVPSDVTPPSTEIICDGATCLSKYNRDVDVGFVCTDNVGGVGCAKTYYDVKKDGSPYKSGSCDQTAGKCANVVTLQAPPAGNKYTYTITFYSEDLNGNVESPNQVVIEIGVASSGIMTSCSLDWAPEWPRPGDTISVTGRVSSGILQNATLTLAGSTLNVSYNCGTLDDKTKPECTQSGIILPSSPSSYTVSVTISGTDIYGNTGDCTTDTIIVDGEPPSVSITNPDACKWYRTDFTADVTATDNPSTNASDIISWEYSISDGVDPEYTSGVQTYLSAKHTTSESFTVTVGPGKYCEEQGEKVCNVSASFTDRAGNTGTDKKEYSIDYTPPTTTVSYTKYGWTNADFTVTFTCNDYPTSPRGSGCDRIEYALDDTLSAKNDRSCTLSFSKTGSCPPEGPLTGTKTLDVTCPDGEVCKYTLTYTTYDVAGNKDGPHTLSLHDAEYTGGAYLIDKQPPRCDITLAFSPDKASNGWTLGTYTWLVSCTDYDGSGINRVVVSLKNPGCAEGDCELACVLLTSCDETTGICSYETVNCSGTTCTYDSGGSYGVKDVRLHCDVRPAGFDTGICTADGIEAKVTDNVGLEYSTEYLESMKIDRNKPYVEMALPVPSATDPVTGVCPSGPIQGWFKSVKETVNAYDPGASTCNSGIKWVCVYVGNANISASVDGGGTWRSGSTRCRYVHAAPESTSVTFVFRPKGEWEGPLTLMDKGYFAEDWVGNVSDRAYYATHTYYLDGKPPYVVSSEITPAEICSASNIGASTQAFILANIEDDGSGLKQARILVGGVEVYSTSWGCGTSFDQISTTVDYSDVQMTGPLDVEVELTDQLGNTKTYNIGTITIKSACTYPRCWKNVEGYSIESQYCQSVAAGDAPTDSVCGTNPYNGWWVSSSGSWIYYCSNSDVWRKKDYTYQGYTGNCALDSSGEPYCTTKTTTCTKYEIYDDCTGDLVCQPDGTPPYCGCPSGEQLCSGDQCYDPDTEVCCDGTIYTGDCCSSSDCPSNTCVCDADGVTKVCYGYGCINHSCQATSYSTYNCANDNGYYCNGNTLEYRSYSCSNGSCTYTVTYSDDCTDNYLDGFSNPCGICSESGGTAQCMDSISCPLGPV